MGSDGAGLDVAVVVDDGAAVVRLVGDLDLATAPVLRGEIADLVARGVHTVAVDLARLQFMDSTGLGVLIAGLKRLRQGGGDLTLRYPNIRVLRMLTITGMTKVFRVTRAAGITAPL